MANGIHQEILFDTTPARLYRVLTDAAEFSTMSGGAPASIEPTAGGAFSCFGGLIVGRNIECVPGERLVQAWRVKTWAEGLYSIARFELQADGSRTRLVLDHGAFPADQREHLAQGWHANYWEPMRQLLTQRV